MDKRTKYFITSAVLTFLAVSAFAIFRLNYLKNSLFEFLFYHDMDVYISLITLLAVIITLIFGIRGSLKARIVWLGVLFELIYMTINLNVYSIFFQKPMDFTNYYNPTETSFFNPVFMVMFLFLFTAIIYGFLSLNMKAIRLKFFNKTLIKIAAFFLIFIALQLIEIRVYPSKFFVLIARVKNNDLTFSNDFFLLFFSTVLLIILYSISAFMLLKRKNTGYILAPILLVMFTFRWVGISKYISYVNYGIEPSFIDCIAEYVQVNLIFFNRWFIRTIGMEYLYIQSILSFILALILVNYLKESGTDRTTEINIGKK